MTGSRIAHQGVVEIQEQHRLIGRIQIGEARGVDAAVVVEGDPGIGEQAVRHRRSEALGLRRLFGRLAPEGISRVQDQRLEIPGDLRIVGRAVGIGPEVLHLLPAAPLRVPEARDLAVVHVRRRVVHIGIGVAEAPERVALGRPVEGCVGCVGVRRERLHRTPELARGVPERPDVAVERPDVAVERADVPVERPDVPVERPDVAVERCHRPRCLLRLRGARHRGERRRRHGDQLPSVPCGLMSHLVLPHPKFHSAGEQIRP